MRRLIYICLFVAIVPWIVIGIVREATDDDTKDHYFVRAIFDNASTLVPGEDVKVAGVPVGRRLQHGRDRRQEGRGHAPDRRRRSFTPFKTDAQLQDPAPGPDRREASSSASRAPPRPAARARSRTAPARASACCRSSTRSSPVDLDLLNDILRLPYRQRFAILLNEFGTGLAGRGEDLNEVIHRANPALSETDEVLAILASRTTTLARLARDSDQALAPLAREREHFADFIVQANKTGEATAERARRQRRAHRSCLPDFLRQLRPLMVDLEHPRRPGHAAADRPERCGARPRPPDQGPGHARATASSKAFPSLGDALERGPPGADPLAAADPGPEQARHARSARRR